MSYTDLQKYKKTIEKQLKDEDKKLVENMTVDGLIRPVLIVNSGMKTRHKSGISGSLGLNIDKFHKC